MTFLDILDKVRTVYKTERRLTGGRDHSVDYALPLVHSGMPMSSEIINVMTTEINLLRQGLAALAEKLDEIQNEEKSMNKDNCMQTAEQIHNHVGALDDVYLKSILKTENTNDEDWQKSAMAAEILVLRAKKGNLMLRGFQINQLQNQLHSIRKEKAELDRQWKILVEAVRGEKVPFSEFESSWHATAKKLDEKKGGSWFTNSARLLVDRIRLMSINKKNAQINKISQDQKVAS